MKVVLLFLSFYFIVSGTSCSGQTSSTKKDMQTEVLVADNVSDKKSDNDLLYEHLRLKAESAKKYCSSKLVITS